MMTKIPGANNPERAKMRPEIASLSSDFVAGGEFNLPICSFCRLSATDTVSVRLDNCLRRFHGRDFRPPPNRHQKQTERISALRQDRKRTSHTSTSLTSDGKEHNYRYSP